MCKKQRRDKTSVEMIVSHSDFFAHPEDLWIDGRTKYLGGRGLCGNAHIVSLQFSQS